MQPLIACRSDGSCARGGEPAVVDGRVGGLARNETEGSSRITARHHMQPDGRGRTEQEAAIVAGWCGWL